MTQVSATLSMTGLHQYKVHQLTYDNSMSQLYRLQLHLTSNQTPEWFFQQVGQTALLTLAQEAFFRCCVQSVCLITPLEQGQFQYRIHVVPSCWPLTQQSGCHLFNDMSVIDIAKSLLQPYLPQPKQMLQFALSQPVSSYPRLTKALQYHESQWDFLVRLLQQHGLSLLFQHRLTACPIVITDNPCIATELINVNYPRYQQAQLTQETQLTRLKRYHNFDTPERIRVSGYHPNTPDMSINATCAVASTGVAAQATEQLWRFDATSPQQAQQWATYAAQYYDCRRQGAWAQGQGWLTAGSRLNVTTDIDPSLTGSFLVQQCAWRMNIDPYRKNTLRCSEFTAQLLSDTRHYRDKPRFSQCDGVIAGARVLSQQGDKTGDHPALDGDGHYQAALPEYFGTTGRGTLQNLQTVHLMHSQDHQVNLPMPVGSEIAMAFHADNLDHPFILGALHNQSQKSPTHSTTAQNWYWQDKKHNKIAFINQGTFKRHQKTGRHSATIIESPDYSPWGHSSYSRMGDVVNTDSAYPSVLAQAGFYHYTGGNVHIEHQGGMVQLIGHQGRFNPTQKPVQPVYRLMVQEAAQAGTQHVIESATVDHHERNISAGNSNTSDTLTNDATSSLLDTDLWLQTIKANSDYQYYVNRLQSISGDSIVHSIDQHIENTLAPKHSSEYNGTLLHDTHSAKHTLIHNHNVNQHTANTMHLASQQSHTSIKKLLTTAAVSKVTAAISSSTSNLSKSTAALHQHMGQHVGETGKRLVQSSSGGNAAKQMREALEKNSAIYGIPSITLKINVFKANGKPEVIPPYTVTAKFTLGGKCKLTNNKSVNKLTFNRSKFEIVAKNTLSNFLVGLNTKQINFHEQIVTIGNHNLGYTKATLTIIFQDDNKVIYAGTAEFADIEKQYEGWSIKGNLSIDVTLTLERHDLSGSNTPVFVKLAEEVKSMDYWAAAKIYALGIIMIRIIEEVYSELEMVAIAFG